MIPQPGQYVKCFLKNSTVVEGTVENWDDKSVVLKSVDTESLLIIHHPTTDIMMTKVVLAPPLLKQPAVPPPPITEPQLPTAEEGEQFSEEELHRMSLVDLHVEKVKQERRIFANKLKEHYLGQVRTVKYEQPGFRKIPRTE